MKKILLAAGLFLFVGFASAQSTQNSKTTNNGTTVHKTTVHNSKKKSKKAKTVTKKPLNQRKEYQWKNGQEATPTGHEATGVNGGYSAIKKDTTRKNGTHKQDH